MHVSFNIVFDFIFLINLYLHYWGCYVSQSSYSMGPTTLAPVNAVCSTLFFVALYLTDMLDIQFLKNQDSS